MTFLADRPRPALRVGRVLVDRTAWLVTICRGRRVLSLGCAASPQTLEKLGDGTLLYPRLLEVAESVVGVDLDQAGLAILQNRYPDAELICADAERLPFAAGNGKFDVVVAGEILEHLSNPGRFLEGLRSVMSRESDLALTTVNAQSTLLALRGLYGAEIVHRGHVAYYSARTLVQLLNRHGFDAKEIAFFYLSKSRSVLRRLLTSPIRLWARCVNARGASGLLVRAQLCSTASEPIHRCHGPTLPFSADRDV